MQIEHHQEAPSWYEHDGLEPQRILVPRRMVVSLKDPLHIQTFPGEFQKPDDNRIKWNHSCFNMSARPATRKRSPALFCHQIH